MSFHSSDYEECRLLGCYTVWLLQELAFWKNVAPHHQGDKNLRARNNVNSN
jgi:hypothetical protein